MTERAAGHGTIELVVGPMFSGKSTELGRRIRRMRAARKQWLPLTYKGDNRYFGNEEVMGTHDRESFPARKVTRLSEVFDDDEELRTASCVVVDEGQFFDDLAAQIWHWAFELHKDVIVGALNSTFQRRPFDTVSPLYAMAASIQHLTAVCVCCGQDAPFTKRLPPATPDDDADADANAIVLVGGAERYEARCGRCFDASDAK